MSARIMAIINTSSDSFNGDGIDVANEALLRQRIEAAIAQGADMLDIGGQSTRPGANIISVEEELRRIIPAIEIARSLTDMPLSIDTFKPAVARTALAAGASIVNDIHGCEDLEMRRLVASEGAEVVIMHSRGTPHTMSGMTTYAKGVELEVKSFLLKRAKDLEKMGVKTSSIIIDPGIGFAKTAPQSFELTREIGSLVESGYRVLYGASQKSFLGKALARDGSAAPLEDRAVATVAVQFYAMLYGAAIVRVHDVQSAVQTRTILEALEAKMEIMP